MPPSQAPDNGVDLDVTEGVPPGSRELLTSAVPLIIWEAGLAESGNGTLKEYVSRHVETLTCQLSLLGGTHKEKEALVSRLIVLCNKSDVQPCPLPEIAALDPGTLFLAGSAVRGTNMRELWRRVETCAARRH